MQNTTRALLWNTAALLIAYMAVAMPMPVISGFVTGMLGFSNGLGGLIVGIPFLTTILSRAYAGRLSDRLGGRNSMTRGLLVYVVACALCFAAVGTSLSPVPSYCLLLLGRLVQGFGESLVMVGMLSWNISLLGPQRSGSVFATVGASMYGAIAGGGALGILLVGQIGFPNMMLLCLPLPLLGCLMIRAVPKGELLPAQKKQSLAGILKNIWKQGAAVGFQGVGFAALGAFISLYFDSKGWNHAGAALACFGAGFVIVRLTLGHLPDKMGGKKVALVSLGVEASGQLLLWLALSPLFAFAGAFLTGLGCSLVFPAMGAEVVRLVRPEQRGTAVGGFSIFQDIAYGATAPIAGIFADRLGYSVVYFLGLAAALLGLCAAFSMTSRKQEALT